MKTNSLIVFIVLMLFNVKTKAQNSTWNFHTMLSIDDPANMTHLSGADILMARNNFQQHLGLERVFSVHKNLGILLGANTGFLRSYFWYQRLDGFSSGLELREIKYFGAHSGLSVSHHFNKYFYCQLNVRAGVISIRPSTSNPPEIIPPESSDEIVPLVYRRLPFSVNEEDERHFFIKPDLAVGLKIPKIPISITMGIGRLYSPKTLIEGEIELRQYYANQEHISNYKFNDGPQRYWFHLRYQLSPELNSNQLSPKILKIGVICSSKSNNSINQSTSAHP